MLRHRPRLRLCCSSKARVGSPKQPLLDNSSAIVPRNLPRMSATNLSCVAGANRATNIEESKKSSQNSPVTFPACRALGVKVRRPCCMQQTTRRVRVSNPLTPFRLGPKIQKTPPKSAGDSREISAKFSPRNSGWHLPLPEAPGAAKGPFSRRLPGPQAGHFPASRGFPGPQQGPPSGLPEPSGKMAFSWRPEASGAPKRPRLDALKRVAGVPRPTAQPRCSQDGGGLDALKRVAGVPRPRLDAPKTGAPRTSLDALKTGAGVPPPSLRLRNS
jgi:hypothetical protein